ncbi:MAG: LysE family translocator [Ketobacteraceae bacterium]|nr:LysE family translocator [Ketobacteraceae bacterium]
MEYYLSIVVFTFAGAFTPGPNPVLLISSGANYGIRRSLPVYFGICLGFPLLVAAIGGGLGALFSRFPFAHSLLKIVGAAYLLYLAWRTATGARPDADIELPKPLTFREAMVFQWVNPKAWVVAMGAIATFTREGEVFESILIILSAFMISGFVGMGFWLTLGARLETWLYGARYRVFNGVMGVLLALTVIPIVLADLSFTF